MHGRHGLRRRRPGFDPPALRVCFAMRAEHGSLQSAKSRDVLHCYHSVIGQRVLSVIGSQFVAAAGRFLMVSPTSSVRWSSGRRSREEDEERESLREPHPCLRQSCPLKSNPTATGHPRGDSISFTVHPSPRALAPPRSSHSLPSPSCSPCLRPPCASR